MQFNSLNDQLESFLNILKKNRDLMEMLDFISNLKLPNFYIAAGAIMETIWNYYEGNDLNYNIKDLDVVYFNDEDISVEKDLEYYQIINDYAKKKGINYEIDVSNEARMHLWKMKHGEGEEVLPYQNTEDAISKWIATTHAIGITKENEVIKVYAPFGLSDIFSKTIRPIKHQDNTKELYYKKVTSWQKRFENLTIIEW